MFEQRHIQLSGDGAARRAAMLDELIDAMQAHHARRRSRRRAALAGGAAALMLLATYFIVNAAPTPAATPVQVAHLETMQPSPTLLELHGTVATIVRIETIPGIAERYRAEATHMVKRLDDRELLDTLRAVDRPAGLVRMGEKVFVTASVADQPTPFERPNSL